MNTPALNFETSSLNFIRKNNPPVNITKKNPCVIISERSVGMLRKRTVTPKTKTIFIILDPMILPMIMSVSPCLAAVRDAASSGSEVPSATIVIPITKEETPRAIAIPFAPKTKK